MTLLFEQAVDPFPSPELLVCSYPLSENDSEFIYRSRETINQILFQKDRRALLIVGPCSLHDEVSTLEYAERLKKLSDEVKGSFFIVMRSFVEKARSANGWKGMINDPDLNGKCDIEAGLKKARRLLLALTKMRVPLCSELVEITTAPYFSDLLSLGTIGSRSSASQPHRLLASSMPFAVGFKNSPDGSLLSAIQAILVGFRPHTFLGGDQKGKVCLQESLGNPNCFLILRGGRLGMNCSKQAVEEALSLLNGYKIPFLPLVDCAHDNSQKNIARQKAVFEEAVALKKENLLSGMMVESFLHSGAQPFSSSPRFGLSITDPCLGWEETEELVKKAHKIKFI